MKHIFLFIIVLLISVSTQSQNMYIKELSVIRGVLETHNIIEERMSEGPILVFSVIIENPTDSDILLFPSNMKFCYSFSFLGNVYKQNIPEINILEFIEEERLILKPEDEINLTFANRVFLGTNILPIKNKDSSYNYSIELLHVLGTLKLIYQDKEIKISTSDIRRVNTESFCHVLKE